MTHFNLDINEICAVSNMSQLLMFADDTEMFCCGKDLKTITDTVVCEIEKLRDGWMELCYFLTGMKLNV